MAIALAANPTLTTLGGTQSVAVSNGQAVFSNLILNATGTGYSLSASSGTLTGTTTSTFNVVPGTPTQLAIVPSLPASTIAAGTGFSVTVAAEDSVGNVNPSYSGNVTIALANNPGSTTLGGTAIVTASGGYAVFSGLTLTAAASGYTLQATSPRLTPVNTSSIAVVAGATAQLIITSQPTTVTAGTAFAVTVAAEDSYGNLATGFPAR